MNNRKHIQQDLHPESFIVTLRCDKYSNDKFPKNCNLALRPVTSNLGTHSDRL